MNFAKKPIAVLPMTKCKELEEGEVGLVEHGKEDVFQFAGSENHVNIIRNPK